MFQLPETEIKASLDACKFELHSKELSGPATTSLPLTFAAHKAEIKGRWLQDICNFATDQVALQEHTTDDLRIDPNHVQTIDVQVLKLPQRIDSTNSDSGIRPSDIAKDHFLTKSHRRVDNKGERQAVTEKTTALVQQSDQVEVEVQSQVEKKLCRSIAVVDSSEEQGDLFLEQKEVPIESAGVSQTPFKTEQSRPGKDGVVRLEQQDNQTPIKQEGSKISTVEEEKARLINVKKEREEVVQENDRRRQEDLKILEKRRKEEEDLAQRQEDLARQQELRKLKELEEELERKSQEEAEKKVQLKNEENLRKIKEIGDIVIQNKSESVQLTTVKAADSPTTIATEATGSASSNSTGKSDDKHNQNAKEVPLKKIVSKPIGDPDPPDRKPPHRNSDGSHPPTVIPDFNPPPPLVYHTTFEVSLHKEPLPPPPVPPKVTHKVVVHNESLEKRTEEFLRGHCEFDAINYSLESAQSKIKDIKSTFGKSKQETDLVQDTVRKAKSGEFQKIVHPPVPLVDPHPKQKAYDVVEIVVEPEECDKLPEELQKKYDITKELLLTKKEKKMSSSSNSTYHKTEGTLILLNFLNVILVCTCNYVP